MSKSPSSRPPKDSVPAYSVPPYVVPPTYNPVVDASLPDNGTRIPLPRNSACLQCRRRRIKCDAAKPQCGACLRSHAWAVRTGAVPCPILDCQYGADSETTVPPGKADPSSTKRNRKGSFSLPVRRPEETDDEAMTRILQTADTLKLQEYGSMLQTRLGNQQPSSWKRNSPDALVWPTSQAAEYRTLHPDLLLDHSITPPNFIQGHPLHLFDETACFQQAVFPGWPRDLPNPTLMGNVIDAFFALVPILPHIFNRARFLLRMSLPPFHPDFPNIATLHAICASTARYVGEVDNGPIDDNSLKGNSRAGNPRFVPGFVARHAALAKEAIDHNLAEVKNIYETAQALCILMHHHHVEGLLLEGWLTTGSLARLLNPLGITHESYSTDLRPAMGLLLPPPKDDIEKHERRNLLWCAVLLDIRMESIGNWSGSISVDDIGVPLPSITESFDPKSSFIPENQQTANSPDIWMRHASKEGFCLYVKSMILLSKVNLFTNKRRLWNDHASAMISQEFMDLDAAIATFTMSCPLGMLDPLATERPKYSRTLNDDLLSTQLVIYTLSMKLHEPFAVFHDISNPHTRRVLTAAREVLRLVYRLSATSFDLRLVCHGEFVLFNAARVLVGFLRMELSTGSGAAGKKETLEAEIDVFISLFYNRSLKFPIGLAITRSIEMLLRFARNPSPKPPSGPPPLGISGGRPAQPSGRRPDQPPTSLRSQANAVQPKYKSEGPSASGSSLGDEAEIGTGGGVGAGAGGAHHALAREVS